MQSNLSVMTEEELTYLSRQFANMFGFPVRLFKNNEIIYYYSLANLIVDPVVLCLNEIIKEDSEVAYYIYNHDFYYGIVNYKQYKFVIGPVSELKISENELRSIALLLSIKKENTPFFILEMKALSGIHLDTIIQASILYNFMVNRNIYDISDIRIKMSEQSNISSEIKEHEISANVNTNFFNNYARSYSIEKSIIKKVKKGDIQGLIDGATKVPSVSSGNLAPQLIRHHKNFFIRLETIVSRAAISAGLDVDEVFLIEEMYIKKCETLNEVDRIKNLQYHMILDYADRVNKLLEHNKNNSKMVNEVIKYINSHISEAVKTSDIANYMRKSRGGLTTEFKKQTNMNLSDFIKFKKIQKAEDFLRETNESLTTISSYLGFSSQSHFCRVFKEINGSTPTEYREKNK